MSSTPADPSGTSIVVVGEAMIELAGVALGAAAKVAYGGDTINTAVYLARAGGDGGLSVRYLTALGDDPLSDQMLLAWNQEGIKTDLVRRIPGKLPGIYSIVTDSAGERRFFYWRDASAARQMLTNESAASLSARLEGCGWLYFTGITLAILAPEARSELVAAAAQLRSGGVSIAFDSNYRAVLWPSVGAARAAIGNAIAVTDLALLSAADERTLWGDASPRDTVRRTEELGVREVVVRDGARPCWIHHVGATQAVPAQSVEPVDTTAAGDAFNAAYLAARIAKLAPPEAARSGHELAARVIRHRGAIMPCDSPP